MKTRLLFATLVLGMTAPAAAQVPGLDIDLRAGVNSSSLSDTPSDLGFVDSNSELGWFVGGDIKFGSFLFFQPGVYYQHQSFDLDDGDDTDGVGVSSFMFPLQAGLDLDLKVVAAEVALGPTLTFNTSVGDNDFGIEKDDLNGTRVGGLISGKVSVLFLTGWVGYQFDFTDALKNGGANLNQWMFGLGVNF